MIALQMPSQAAGILKNKQRFSVNTSLGQLETMSRPNLYRYHLKPSIYELSIRKIDLSLNQEQYSLQKMVASTADNDNYCKLPLPIITNSFLPQCSPV